VLSLLCAAEPNRPNTPSTSVDGDSIVFAWTEPSNQGSPITGYMIEIRNHDLGFVHVNSVCDGSSQYSMDNLECRVPITTLKEAPYNLIY
jgi:hypothetical protein